MTWKVVFSLKKKLLEVFNGLRLKKKNAPVPFHPEDALSIVLLGEIVNNSINFNALLKKVSEGGLELNEYLDKFEACDIIGHQEMRKAFIHGTHS